MAHKIHFDFDYLSSRPKRGKNEIPLWCDYLEMLCLIEYHGYLSKGEVIDTVFREGRGVVANDDSEEDEDEDGNGNLVTSSSSLAQQIASMGSNRAQISDRNDAIINDWFMHLSSRDKNLGDVYPFAANSLRNTLCLKSDLTPANHLYLYLLLASNLHLFSEELRTKITSDFEYVCLEAQKLMFPLALNGASIHTHLFGKNPASNSLFTGKYSEKITKLGELIQARSIDVSFLKDNNTGDGGIDLVSVMKFDSDKAFGPPLVISQCACSYKEWKAKQAEHDISRFRQLRIFDVEYLRMIYIPFYYRDQAGQWFNIFDVHLSVIDRLRLLKIFINQPVKSYNFVKNWTPLAFLHDRSEREIFASFLVESG